MNWIERILLEILSLNRFRITLDLVYESTKRERVERTKKE